jgi:hypothetical protein
LALRFGQAHDQVEAAVALDQLAGNTAPNGGGHRFLHIARVQAIPCQCRRIWRDGQQRQAGDLLGLDVFGAGDATHDPLDPAGQARQLVKVVAVDLDRHVRTDAGDQLVGAHLDGLGELVVAARDFLGRRLQLFHQLGLGLARVGPLVAGLEHQEGVGHRRRHRIGGHLGGADLEKMLATSGNWARRFSSVSCMATDCSSWCREYAWAAR